MDSYWLIERMVVPEVGWFQVAWLSLGSRNRATESTYIHEWTTDTKDAIRFPRQQDAEKIFELLFPLHCSYSVTEYMDVDSAHPGVVPGWVMVPVEPTDEMVEAACAINLPSRWDGLIKEVTARYKAMLAATPKGHT